MAEATTLMPAPLEAVEQSGAGKLKLKLDDLRCDLLRNVTHVFVEGQPKPSFCDGIEVGPEPLVLRTETALSAFAGVSGKRRHLVAQRVVIRRSIDALAERLRNLPYAVESKERRQVSRVHLLWQRCARPNQHMRWATGEWCVQDGPTANGKRVLIHAARTAAAGKFGDIGWHTFRHTYRSWLDETGAPMKVQQELMRHASI